MARKFTKINRQNCRQLQQGDKLIENGIHYEKLQNGDGRFKINVMVDGQRIHRTVGLESEGITREKAETMIEQFKTDARNNRLKLPKGRKLSISFEAVAHRYIERLKIADGKDIDKKESRLKNHLIPYFGEKRLEGFSSFDIDRYKHHRKSENAKPATINRELAVLSHLFNKAEDWGWLEKKPCKVKSLKEDNNKIVYLNAKECDRLINAAKQDSNPQMYWFILIGLSTAMRRSEILSLRIEHIHTDKLYFYLPKAKAGARMQPITNDLAIKLGQYITTLPSEQEWLFPSIGNLQSESGHTKYIDEAFKRIVKRANLDHLNVTPHTLRHTATTHLVHAGVDVPTIQSITGHKTPSMVFRYAHTQGNRVRHALDALEQKYQQSSQITHELHTAPENEKTQSLKSGTEYKLERIKEWYPQGNSNPCRLREREVS